MTSGVDAYLSRARRWRAESQKVREILLDCGLDESIKWGKPCFGREDGNLAILQPMKDFLALMFFKGVLLDDPRGLLHAPGANSNHGRRLHFTGVDEVLEHEAALRDFVRQAIDIQDRGLVVEPTPHEMCAELRDRLDRDPPLRAAFEALTPGRRRAYDLFVSGAKQSATRFRRIEQHVERILAGKGLRDP